MPKYIREKMHRIALYAGMASNLDREVGLWLERNGIDVEKLSDGSGGGYEELSYGNDVTDELVRPDRADGGVTMEVKLKTCPFCGADNKPMGAIMRTANRGEWKHWYNGCVLSGFVIKADKIEAWNRRVCDDN